MNLAMLLGMMRPEGERAPVGNDPSWERYRKHMELQAIDRRLSGLPPAAPMSLDEMFMDARRRGYDPQGLGWGPSTARPISPPGWTGQEPGPQPIPSAITGVRG